LLYFERMALGEKYQDVLVEMDKIYMDPTFAIMIALGYKILNIN